MNKQVKIIDPKEFVIAALNADSKTFIIYVAIKKSKKMPLNSEKEA